MLTSCCLTRSVAQSLQSGGAQRGGNGEGLDGGGGGAKERDLSQLRRGLALPAQSLLAPSKGPGATRDSCHPQATDGPLALPHPVCRRQIFTERVAGVLVPYAQQTNRLAETGTLVG